ncbi:MAG: amidohydrolase [Dethiosulfatibacter sp.]|nr:amidohydrolase [Dethiosulfatibacter sp.]
MVLKDEIDLIIEEIISIRRDIHAHPELGMEEYRTAEIIKGFLDKNNIENYSIANTGVVGVIKGQNGGKTVAIRADIDALPIEEKTDLSFKSVHPNKMHACGHDVHTAILLGAGQILKKMENDLTGNVKLFFQPAEETVGGALPMINEGCMDNPKVDFVIGLHVSVNIPTGSVQFKYNKMNASTDEFTINVSGKAGHGAYPQDTVDAIVIAGHLITALQTVVSRNISPIESVVISIGTIQGGSGSNIIADKVHMTGTLRALNEQQRQSAKNNIIRIVENTCSSMGGIGRVEFTEGYKALVNNDEVVDILKEKAVELLGKDHVYIANEPSLGAEDFSFFLDKAKGAFYNLGCGNINQNIVHKGHHPMFLVDEDCIKTGILLQVENAISLLNNK